MHERIVRVLVCCMALLIAVRAEAADATFGADYATAYIFRGQTLSHRSVLQPYLEVIPEEFPLTLGVWGNFGLADDTRGYAKRGEFSEVDLYASYALPLGLDWLSMSVGYNEYTYPTGDVDADREAAIKAALNGFFLTPELGVYLGLGGSYAGACYLEASLSREQELYKELKGKIGVTTGIQFQGTRSDAKDGFSFVKLGLEISYEFVKAGMAYYFETDKSVLDVDEHWLGTAGVAFEF